jgi:hypothetical protein
MSPLLMTTDDRVSNLMFLLTLTPLAACSVGGEPPPNTSGPPTVDPTVAGDGTTTGPSGDSDTRAESTSTSGVEGPESTDGPGPGPDVTTDDPPASTTSPVECENPAPPMIPQQIGQACLDYGSLNNECFYGGSLAPECLYLYQAYCQYYIDNSAMMYGPDCAMANEEFLTCLSQLSCQVLSDATQDCPNEQAALNELCID